jgi:putative oligomerization/nucleic acid binding protein
MTPDSRRPSGARLAATGCIILPASLFVGLMIASAGTAIYPRVAWPGAALLCSGELVYESHGQSYRPGEYTVTRQIYCRSGSGKGAASEEITFRAIGLAFLIYSALAFLLLRFLVAPWLRRRAERSLSAVGLHAPTAAADLGAILGRVSEAAGRGRAAGPEAPGDDPAERLAQLKGLRDRGLITAEDYEAKKAQILSQL